MLTRLLLALVISTASFGANASQLPHHSVIVSSVEIGKDHRPAGPLQAFATLRVSSQGQAVTKVVAGYFDIPPSVVDQATKNWKGLLSYKEEGEETRGIVRAPVGYTICHVTRISEVSITGASTLVTTILRNPVDNGLGYYLVVPFQGWLHGGEWARATYRISFIKASPGVMNKLMRNCDPEWKRVTDCNHGPGSCRPPYVWRDHP